jgi:hypothetical protein
MRIIFILLSPLYQQLNPVWRGKEDSARSKALSVAQTEPTPDQKPEQDRERRRE